MFQNLPKKLALAIIGQGRPGRHVGASVLHTRDERRRQNYMRPQIAGEAGTHITGPEGKQPYLSILTHGANLQ